MSDLFDFAARPALYAVMGNPIAHSKSPRIHAMFAEQCGLSIEYRAIQVDPGGFAQAVSNFRAAGGRGLNVTVPFKIEACKLAERRSRRAEIAGAVNTLKWEDGDRLFGDNTDGQGLVSDITCNLARTLVGCRVLMVGAGGAARGVLGPLLEAGPRELVIANRTVDKAMDLAMRFAGRGDVGGCGFEALAGRQFDVVINATAASLRGEVPALPAQLFASAALAYDMAYGDGPTAFMSWAREQGAARVVDGIGMLVEQAAESFCIWHGVRPATAAVIAALRGGSSG